MSHYKLNDYAFNGDLENVKKCIENGAELDLLDEEGYSALHWAIQEGYEEIVMLLVNKGADIDKKNKEGFTPLHIALLDDQTNIAIDLINKGASLEIESDGYNALHLVASKTGNTKILQRLCLEKEYLNKQCDYGQGYAPIHYASQENNVKCIKVLGDAGADFNIKEMNGFTPLHLAAGEGHAEAVEALILGKANLEIENSLDDNSTPLMLAVSYKNFEVVKVLLKYKANINHKNADGYTALEFAEKNRNKKIIKILKESL